MRRYMLVLLLFALGSSSAAAQQPIATDAELHQRIALTAFRFEGKARQFTLYSGHGNWGISGTTANHHRYPAGDLDEALSTTKVELLENLPADALPLRDYVNKNFPAEVPNVAKTEMIDMSLCAPYINGVKELLTRLAAVSTYRLDLIADSVPQNALFELESSTGEKWSKASRGTFSNVWRGQYSYRVTRDGEKPITGIVDLIRESGNTLRCTFVHNTSTSSPLPCDLVASP